jgi:hypothetical protein
MDTGWIQVFVLTVAECVAPAGKSVCQQSQFELKFLSQSDCEFAFEQLVELKSADENVIVDKDRSGCTTSTVQSEIFPNLSAATNALSAQPGWRPPEADEPAAPGAVEASYQERLDSLETCEKTGGVAPCKVGQIIVEEESEPVEVWRQE